MDSNYIKQVKNWLAQQEARIKQSENQKRFLLESLDNTKRELQLVEASIDLDKRWIDITEQELKKYIEDNE